MTVNELIKALSCLTEEERGRRVILEARGSRGLAPDALEKILISDRNIWLIGLDASKDLQHVV